MVVCLTSKKVIYLTFFVIIMGFMFSCSKNRANSISQKNDISSRYFLIEEYTIDTGYPVSSKLSGTFEDPTTKQAYVYLTNLKTHKKTCVYTLSGKPITCIDLSDLERRGGNIYDLSFVSVDKIVAMTMRGNIFMIDQNGQIEKILYLNSILGEHLNNEEYTYFNLKSQIKNDSLELFVQPLWVNFDINSGIDIYGLSHTQNEYWKLRVKNQRDKPLLYKISLDKEFEYTTQAILPHFYRQLSDTTKIGPVVLRLPHYNINQEFISISSKYSDSLWRYTFQNQVLSSYKIKSQHGKVGMKTTSLDSPLLETTQGLSTVVNTSIKEGAYVLSTAYNDKNKLHYITVKHKTAHTSLSNWLMAQKSILVYDENYQKLEEIYLPEGYYRNTSWSCSKGLIIPNYNLDNSNFSPTTFQYKLLSYP